ncbi:hypothetical protein FKM82_029828 [Ascaphus truei]
MSNRKHSPRTRSPDGKDRKMPNRKESPQKSNIYRKPFARKTFSRKTFSCKDCKYTSNIYRDLTDHFDKTGHERARKNEKTLNRPGNDSKSSSSGNNAGSMDSRQRKSMQFLKDYMKRADREPLVGLEYVLEYRVEMKTGKIETKYQCDLCELDMELVPMIEHLAGFRHRKLYFAKEFPFVLKAPSRANEDRMQFIKRMALEAEQEQGTKMYKIHSATKMESLLTLQLPTTASKRKTRWDNGGNSESRTKRALEYLETFDVDSDSETVTITNLTKKLTDGLKQHSLKAKQEALFPVQVAKAKDVALAIMQGSSQQLLQSNTVPGSAQQFSRGAKENVQLNWNSGMQGASFPQNTHGTENAQPKAYVVNQSTQNRPQVQSTQNYAVQNTFTQDTRKTENSYLNPSSKMQEASSLPQNTQKRECPPSYQNSMPQSDSLPQTDVNAEDIQFYKKLKALLASLPQNSPSTENVLLDPKLMMLKALLLDKTPSTEYVQLSQKLMTLKDSQPQNTPSTENVSLNQKLMMLMTSQNSSNPENVMLNQKLMMQMASMGENSVSFENVPLNQKSMMPVGSSVQNTSSTENVQLNQNAMMPMAQNLQNTENRYPELYQPNMQAVQDYSNTSQNRGDFGYEGQKEGPYSSQYNTPLDPMSYQESYGAPRDNAAAGMTYQTNEMPQNQYQDIPPASDMYPSNSEWENPPDPSYCEPFATTPADDPSSYHGGYVEEQSSVPYTRVCLSPGASDMSHEAKNVKQWQGPASYSGTDVPEREIFDQYRMPNDSSSMRCSPGSLQTSSAHQSEWRREPRHDNELNRSRESDNYSPSAKYSEDPAYYSSSHENDRGPGRNNSRYAKRPRMDTDCVVPHRSGSDRGSYRRSTEPSESLNLEGLSSDILKRIRGKDLFTVSAILSEYKETHQSK